MNSITFDQWNELPRKLKLGDDRILDAIESDPAAFNYFDNGAVQNGDGDFVINSNDYF